MNPRTTHSRRMQGFSLIELMIALVAGLIVIGAVLAFTLSSLRSNTQMVQAARLSQELRNSMDFISREFRRAGYDENALGYYSQTTSGAVTTSPFAMLLVQPGTAPDGACVIYAYDRQPGTAGTVQLANGEIRGIRRRVRNGVGVIEVAESAGSTAPACGGGSPNYTTYPASCSSDGWCALSDPRTANISQFSVDTTNNFTVAAVASSSPLTVRSLDVTLRGNLIGQPEVDRTVSMRIRVRADCLQSAAACNIAPVGT